METIGHLTPPASPGFRHGTSFQFSVFSFQRAGEAGEHFGDFLQLALN
jgi:hypothetical protein